jgi:hypothetical protein
MNSQSAANSNVAMFVLGICIMAMMSTGRLAFSVDALEVMSRQRACQQILATSPAASLLASLSIHNPEVANAAAAATSATEQVIVEQGGPSPNGLASRLLKRDPVELQNKLFNIPPSAQVYPTRMRGTWQVASKFNGYLFPSRKIPRERLTQNFGIPGFQKCSIAHTPDGGKEDVSYEMTMDELTNLH